MSDFRHSRGRNVPKAISRRQFVKRLGGTALGGGLSLSFLDTLCCAEAKSVANPSSKPKYEIRNRVEGMTYIPLGRTNLMVSRLAFGGMPWQPNVVRRGVRLGINLVHGSTGYGTMEAQAQTLAKLWDKCWYVLKQGGGAKKMSSTVDACLKTLKRDHVEIIVPVISRTKSVDYDEIKSNFEKLKKAGKVRTLGVTIHSKEIPAVCREVIDAGIFDMILTMYQSDNKAAIDKELAGAVKKNIGTMSMKTGQGLEKEDVPKAIAAALAGGTICTVLKGVGSMNDLNAYLNAAKASGSKEIKGKQQVSIDPAVCGACGACSVCPQNINIQEIMRCRTYYYPEPALRNYARQTYQDIPAATTFAGCIDCGQCEEHCPRGLAIRHTLKTAHEKWNAIA